MTTTDLEPPPADTTTPCDYQHPTHIEPDDDGVVEPALRHMATAAANASNAMAHNHAYRAGAAVDALTTTVAVTCEIADHLAPYAGDLWTTAGRDVADAHLHLRKARAHLDAARHTTTLCPPDNATQHSGVPDLAASIH